MDYKDLLKKYWFVGLIAILLIVFIGVYAVDSYNNRELTVSSKDVDGKSVVYSVDNEYVYADDFYYSLYNQNGASCAFSAYQRAILDASYETTDEMKTYATSYATYYLQQYGEEYIDNIMKQYGYVNGADDFVQYYIDAQKSDLLTTDYIKSHAEDLKLQNYIDENNARVIYHILISVADVTKNDDGTLTANMTDEEKAKLENVQEALKSTAFQEVAEQYSDDSGSAISGGLIGCVSSISATNYVTTFAEAAIALENDKVSEPILSEYGYHIIWNAGNSLDTMLNDSNFISEISDYDTNINLKSVMEKGNELGFIIVDPELSTLINSQLESEDAE